MAQESQASSSSYHEENALEHLSLNILFKFIKPFNGSRSELNTFLQNGNSAFQLAQPNQKPHLFLYIVSQLSSDVVNEIELEDVSSWTQLKEKLKTYYGKIMDLTQLHEELETIRQGSNESVTDFYKRLEKLKNACITAEDNQCEDSNEFSGLKKAILRTALRRFILHTKPEISQMLRARDITNLNEAFSMAIQEEKILNYTKNHKPQASLYCSYCKINNHSTQNCRKKFKTKQEFLKKSSSAYQNQSPNSYNSTKFCNYCKNKGHEISECRKRQFYNNTRPSNYDKSNPKVNHVNNNVQEIANEPPIPEDSDLQRSFRINTITRENDPKFITFYSPNAEKNLKFLIDTGAAVSLIKHDVLSTNKTTLDIKDIISITGINRNMPISTLGSTDIELELDYLCLKHRIHVINSYKINMDYDGILGEDFFLSQKAEISYTAKTIKIADTIIPFNNKISDHKAEQTITLPARSEIISQIHVSGDLKEGIIKAQEISPNVFIPNSFVTVSEEGNAVCSITNLNENQIKIKKPTVALEEIEKPFQINFVNSESVSVNDILKDTQESNKVKQLYSTSNRYQSRNAILKENLRTEHMNAEERKALVELCLNYSDIFHLPDETLSITDTLRHEIPTVKNSPIAAKPYRYPKIHEEEVKTQVSNMLKQGIIQTSTSPYSSPVWVVPKKTDASGQKKWRLVIDFRKLNDVTIGDAYPLPNMDTILDQLGQAKYFTTLDLSSGFHQIQMHEKDKPKTAFSTPQGHFEFNRMPFGLKNAPATFQRLMNIVLSGLTGIKSFVYLDDIVVYGSSLQAHNNNLRDVFEKLRQHNLKLQPDKCEFLRKEVAYLGHIITDKGIQPNPEKVKAISEIKIPKNPKDIKSFLGLVGYYRKFIENFSLVAKPLTNLLKKGNTFEWTLKCQEAFEKLKTVLTKEIILQYPDFNREFLLTTDASNEAVGSILSQGPLGKDLPVSYYSRTLNKAEQNYSTTEKELLAIVDSVKHFRPYLFGQKFSVITDHKPLTWLMNCKDPSSRLVRWRLKLLEYDYDIKYKPGKLNTNADALSRPILQITNNESTFKDFQRYHQQTLDIKQPKMDKTPITKIKNLVIPISKDLSLTTLHMDHLIKGFPNIERTNRLLNEAAMFSLPCQRIYIIVIKNFANDSAEYENIFASLKNLKSLLEHNKTEQFTLVDITLQNSKIQTDTFYSLLQYLFNGYDYKILENIRKEITDPETIKRILRDNHDHCLAGHQGVVKTYDRIKRYYYWDQMKESIENYIKKCDQCQRSKTHFKPNKSPMVITTTAETFCERIAMDIVGPLPETRNGNRFILTLQDDLTKFVQAYAMQEHNAPTVAIYFLKFCTQFGFPYTILSDQGTEFTSCTLKEVNKLLAIKHKLCSPYHPESNGALERSHLTLKDYLRCYVNKDSNNWDELLTFALFSYNTSIHKSTRKMPYELVFGQIPRLPTNLIKPSNQGTYTDLARDIQTKMKIVRETARETQISNKLASKKYYDKTHSRTYDFKVGDLVLLRNEHAKRTSKQLKPEFLGPYELIQIHDNHKSASIKLSTNKIRTYNLDLLKPYVSDGQDDDTKDSHLPSTSHNP